MRYQEIRANHVHFEGSEMSIDTSGGHPAMDYNEHTRTYSGFVRAIMLLIVLVVIILIGMLMFLV
jgi:hypothetical protein